MESRMWVYTDYFLLYVKTYIQGMYNNEIDGNILLPSGKADF